MTPPTNLTDVLAHGAVRTAFQPIVELASGAPIGHEALTRGPEGSRLERPDRLFAAAEEQGRVAELDLLCLTSAVDNAIDAGLRRPHWLFLNAEPDTLASSSPQLATAYARAAAADLPLVVEVTERAVTARPAQLLRSLDQAREAGARVAMDDIGADPGALALLSLVRPDVIKLDLRLVQQQPSREVARIVHAVNAEADRTGAAVLAEGIETDEHLATAHALGATLGQGWRFGRPGPLTRMPDDLVAGGLWPVERLARSRRSPHELCAAGRASRVGRKELLIEMSKHLELEAMGLGGLGVVLSTFQEHRHLTPDTARRYRALADRLAFVAALGERLPAQPAPGVRGAQLHPDDVVRGEWDVVVLGPHFAAALTARDLGDRGPEAERRFEFVLTYERDHVLAAADALMARVWADGELEPADLRAPGSSVERDGQPETVGAAQGSDGVR